MWTIPIINGPNLNLTGVRQKEIYGSESMEELLVILERDFPNHNFPYYQSHSEGELIEFCHSIRNTAHAALLNPGGLTHTSVSLRDAVALLPFPVAEIHLSKIQHREPFRRVSLFKDVCYFQISGLGIQSYCIAISRLIEYLNADNVNTVNRQYE